MPNRLSPVGANNDPSYAFAYTSDGTDFYKPVVPVPPVVTDKSSTSQTVVTSKTGKA